MEYTNNDILGFSRKDYVKRLSVRRGACFFDIQDGDFTFTETNMPSLDLLPLRVDVAKMLLRVTQDKDEKGEYDFDATGIRLDIPTDI